ncbi:hypothetical protein L211DRAFT_852329 [Terfezia boudieri ATCC MYA-4762]|uniref:Uncharacterized protein n=1 Tax=Terfezia boudieri ATCC MYA-4762 TaxID=1051890 RepID=A0A3N4LR67_9PEZI|nr:hypothetical protein L211DRAFT_852329 [Terfezia boudieri ATCC MYA-4762]
MFTTFVRRTPPATPETSPVSSPKPKCTCTMERCSRHHTSCNCPDCHAKRWYCNGMSTQMTLQPPYAAPLLPATQVALQYGIGGNIAYPYPIAVPIAHQSNYVLPSAPPYRDTHSHRHCRCRVRWSHSCKKHPCTHPRCEEKRNKVEEEDGKQKEEVEVKNKPCDCPNCGTCQRKKKEEEKQKWWDLAVPGKEGVVVGLACVIL